MNRDASLALRGILGLVHMPLTFYILREELALVIIYNVEHFGSGER